MDLNAYFTGFSWYYKWFFEFKMAASFPGQQNLNCGRRLPLVGKCHTFSTSVDFLLPLLPTS